MFVIGVTGGIGSGKSTFSRFLAEAGLPVLDADALSFSLTAPGGASLPRIRERFGPDFIREDGSLDRTKMAALVFRDKKELDTLSAIIHEDVARLFRERLTDLEKQKCKAAVLDTPLPVKEGFLDLADFVVCIWAEEPLRLDRLEKRGMPRAEAQRRIALQLDREAYARLSDLVIDNNGSEEELRSAAEHFLSDELTVRGIPYSSLFQD